LMAYGDYKPSAKPVVIVHGIGGPDVHLQEMISKLAADPDVQLYVFAYDSQWRFLDQTALDLSHELQTLSAHIGGGQSLKIIAHSMGGVISRGALNYLHSPDWLSAPGQKASDAVLSESLSSFRQIDFVAIDTPWEGFRTGLPFPWRRFMAGLESSRGDMQYNSDFLRSLNQEALSDNVRFRPFSASQGDVSWRLPSLDDDMLMRFGAYLLDDQRSHLTDGSQGTQLETFVSMLEGSINYDRLRELARSRLSLGSSMKASDVRALLSEIELMPVFDGAHASVLSNPSLIDILRE